MQIHLISGFLGSGKTTAIQTACKVLQSENKTVGVITNDQGIMLVDTGYFESNCIPNRQVVNGCFCCNYNALDENIESLIVTNDPDVIFAESVGSCTDIVATVMKPLLKFKTDIGVTVSTFADIRLLPVLFPAFKLLCLQLAEKAIQSESANAQRGGLEQKLAAILHRGKTVKYKVQGNQIGECFAKASTKMLAFLQLIGADWAKWRLASFLTKSSVKFYS